MFDTCITVTLPPDPRWLPFVQDSLHRHAETVGFSPALEQMCADSVLETCEELFRLSAAANVTEPVLLRLDYKGEAVVMEVEYNRRIPLNPHQAEDYEVPDRDTDLDDVDLASLWLYIIKRRMDRVHFAVRGSRHVLRMIKYRREVGKERQAWVMAITPRLRDDLVLHLDDEAAEYPAAVLQAPGHGVLKLGPSETFLVRNMDGKRPFHDLYMAHIDALGLVSPSTLANLYEQLESLGMLRTGEQPQRGRARRLAQFLLAPDFSTSRADAVVTFLYGRLRLLCSLPGILLLLGGGVSGLLPLIQHWPQLTAAVAKLEQRYLEQPLLVAPLYLLLLLHVALHELAHGIACKHFGGKVPRMGAMFYLGSFMFYCDTTAAWNFPRKRQRLLVSLAGPLLSFAVLGLSLWAAGSVAGTNSWAEAVLVPFCLLNMFALIMNFNPFIKMDAYYMLLDLTGIANLRQRSFQFLEHRLLGRLGIGIDNDAGVQPRERRIFWWYSIAGMAMTLLFLAWPIVKLAHLARRESASGGKLLILCMISLLLAMRLGNLTYRKVWRLRHRQYKIQ